MLSRCKFLSFLLLSLALLSPATSAVTNVGGILSTDTTWGLAGSPYQLTSTVQIAYGVILTIEPGVIINGYGAIQVWGILSAVGTSQDPILFNQVEIVPGTSSSTQPFQISLQFARFEGGSLYSPTGSGGHGSLILRDSYLEGVRYLYLWYPAADCYMERNTFFKTGGISVGHQGNIHVFIRNNVFYQQNLGMDIWPTYAVENWASYDASQTIVEFNSVLSTDRIAVQLPPGYTSAAMVATNNFWNTTDTTLIEAMIYDKHDDLSSAGMIPYQPFLTAPHPDTPPFALTHPDIAVHPTRLNFGRTKVGSCKIKQLRIQNTGDDFLSVRALTGLGAPFYLLDGPHAPFTIPPEETVALTLCFAPNQAGSVQQTLLIESNDPDEAGVTVPLTGTGVPRRTLSDGLDLANHGTPPFRVR